MNGTFPSGTPTGRKMYSSDTENAIGGTVTFIFLGLFHQTVPYGIGKELIGGVERLDSNLHQLVKRMELARASLEVDPLQSLHHLVHHPVHDSFMQLVSVALMEGDLKLTVVVCDRAVDLEEHGSISKDAQVIPRRHHYDHVTDLFDRRFELVDGKYCAVSFSLTRAAVGDVIQAHIDIWILLEMLVQSIEGVIE